MIPTSNHNCWFWVVFCFRLYIFWFLHQTTTCTATTSVSLSCISFDSYIKPQPLLLSSLFSVCCISFDSYIKPQLMLNQELLKRCCISFDSYIKPQPAPLQPRCPWVVYLLIPTSNHNFGVTVRALSSLYIFWFLHQTTTVHNLCILYVMLYIFWFLHQTTTCTMSPILRSCCISFDSYIKPQQGSSTS